MVTGTASVLTEDEHTGLLVMPAIWKLVVGVSATRTLYCNGADLEKSVPKRFTT